MSVYVIVILVIAVYAVACNNINENEKRKRKFLLFAFGLLFLVAALRDETVGRDLAGHYAENYRAISGLSWGSLAQFSDNSGYELGFVFFCKLISLVSSNAQWFIVVVSCIIFGSMARFIYKNSEDVVLSTFLVIFSCVYYMFLTMIRQALAVSIILLGYEILKSEKKRYSRYLKYTLLVLLATCFHQSAILAIVFIFFDLLDFKKEYIIFTIVGTILFYFYYDDIYSVMLLFMGNSERYAAHISSLREGVGSVDKLGLINIILTFGAFLIGYYSLVWHKKKYVKMFCDKLTYSETLQLQHEQSSMMYASLFAGIFRLLATQMNIMNRVTYYFLPFTLVFYPIAIGGSRRYRKIIKNIVFFIYLFYYIIMSIKVADSYYGTVPYLFFWQS